MLLLIPLLPFFGFLVNAFLGRRLPKSVSGGVACLAIIGSFVVSVVSVVNIVSHDALVAEATAFNWMASGDLQIPLRLRLDHLSSLMILVVAGTNDGQIFTFFVMTVAAAEAAVGLALVIGLFRHRESLNPEAFTSLKW